jgi:hypothetical protein
MGIAFPHTGLIGEETDKNAAVFDFGLYVKRILITGANGQLGNEMRLLAEEYDNFTFDFTDIAELDLCNAEAVRDYCERTRPTRLWTGPKTTSSCAGK